MKILINQVTIMKNNRKYGIYVNVGYVSELEKVKSVQFNTKKEALEWIKQHGNVYPQKCVMSVADIVEIEPNYYKH